MATFIICSFWESISSAALTSCGTPSRNWSTSSISLSLSIIRLPVMGITLLLLMRISSRSMIFIMSMMSPFLRTTHYGAGIPNLA